MKRLKLQKALLAICLALASTIKISNETNAMENIPKQNELTLEQKSNNNEPNETTQTADTFSQYYDEYAEAEGPPLTKTDKEYSSFLKKYLREDITRYLALLIQANYEQISIWQTKDGIETISPHYIYQLLRTCITIDDDWIANTKYLLIPYNPREEQFTNVGLALNNLFSKPESELTIEQKILSVLFRSATGIECPDEFTSPLAALIDEYKGEIISVVDQSTATLIRFLEPVATQLKKEFSYIKSQKIEAPQLEKLVSLVREFSELYNKKQQETQQLINNLATKKTHKAAIQEFVTFTKIKNVGEKEYKQFLLCYIGNNLVTYLALLLQARYNLLQFPKDITIEKSLNFIKIHDMLFDEYPEQLIKLKLSDKNGPISQAVCTILKLFLYYQYSPQYLKNAAYIILILFITPDKANYNTKITQLKNALEHYISHEQPEPGAPRNTILSLFGEIATQLQEEAAEAFDNSTKAGQLNEIAKLLINFSTAYINKLNQQEQNQNAPNNSTPNFIAQLLWDRPDEETTDNNINNTKKDGNASNQVKEVEQKAKEEEERLEKEEKERLEKKEEDRLKKEEAERKRIAEDENAINEIEKLINEWIKQKEENIKDKEAKLTKLAQDINSLEQKYKKLAEEK